MNWLATIALLCVGVLLAYLGWCWGVWVERRSNRSREEAIRKEAYRAGSEWSADFWRTRCSQTEWDELYQGHFDTKENPHERPV